MSIKVYDTQGQFVDQFGGRGRGRAQLLSIQSMALDGEAIVVADAYRRAFTWWSLDGTFKRELVLDHEVGWPTQFSRLADGRWLLLYLAPPFFHGPLLHIRSRDLSVAEEVVSELKGLVDADAASLFVHASRPGRFALLDGGGTIAYVPGPYEGRVHFFRRSQSGFDHGVLRGYTPQIKPIQDLDASGDHKFVRSFHAGPSTGGERAYALSHETLALRFFSGGTMVHLFRADTPGYEAVLFQVFSPREGKHFGVREIRSLSHEMTTLGWHHEFLGWSSAGSLFVWHYADGAYPVVRAFQFSCLQ